MATRSASLTDDELAALGAALDEGRRPTVYLREPIPSLDVPAGASAKVVAIRGRTVTVRPRRVDDELAYEPHELRMTRTAPPEPVRKAPKRTAAPRKAAGAGAGASAGRPGSRGSSTGVSSAGVSSAGAAAAPSASAGSAAAGSAAAGSAAAGSATSSSSGAAAPAPRKPRGRKGPSSVTVTIEGTSEAAPHEWTVTVTGAGARAARPVPVQADAVVQAVGALGVPAAVKAVDAVLVAARAEAERRVEELARELAEAKKALRLLGR